MINAILVSGMKCGSTWLMKTLSAHPEIRTCLVTVDYSCSQVRLVSPQQQEISHKLFLGRRNLKLNPSDPRIYHEYNPDLRFAALIRDPVKRAYSQFIHHVNKSLMNGLPLKIPPQTMVKERKKWSFDFNQGILKTGSFEELPFYLRKSFYFKNFSSYFEYFSSDRFLILPLEWILQKSDEGFEKIYSFLNVSRRYDSEQVQSVENPGHYASWHLPGFFGAKEIYFEPLQVQSTAFLFSLFREDIDRMCQHLQMDLWALWGHARGS